MGWGNANTPEFVKRKKASSEIRSFRSLQFACRCRRTFGHACQCCLGELLGIIVYLLLAVAVSRSSNWNHLLQHNIHEDAEYIKAERHYLDVSHIQSNCPLLVSTWKEVLRIATLTTTNRCVLADTYIGGQILLKKGGIIQIYTGAFHSDHNIWVLFRC
jgi:hypothetical protein